ncbi:MAG TPA: DUF6644 family protein [Bryobacteraceae bacterium]|jgi:hypothetical protein|nr:DUF6644 family protein [Bryobacteraceae bacterium]
MRRAELPMLLIENPLNESALSFPILECIHILSFAFSVGTIALIDFRLLGVGMRRELPSQLHKDTFYWTLGGLISMFISGLLLFSSDPDMYYLNWAFDLKMVFLVLAILFNYTIHRKTALSDPPGGGKLVAAVSLALWTCVLFGGIFIGFLNPTLDFSQI